jgi:hypothetical protein
MILQVYNEHNELNKQNINITNVLPIDNTWCCTGILTIDQESWIIQ